MIYPEVSTDELCGFEDHLIDVFVNMILGTLVKVLVKIKKVDGILLKLKRYYTQFKVKCQELNNGMFQKL